MESLARPNRKKTRKHPEYDMQAAWFQWFSYQYPQFRDITYKINNEGKRSAWKGRKLKDEGLTPGMPDICCAVPRGTHPSLYIELKVHPNKPTDLQMKVIALLRGQGHKCAICYSLDEAIQVANDYLRGI